jgi:hypothetical protein
VPPGNKDERVKYLDAEASALLKQGFEFGDDTAAHSAIARRRALVELLPRNASPRDWAIAQNELGFALFRKGARESGTARLEQAVAAYQEALQEATRARAPALWAKRTGSQGVALTLLAGRTGDAEMAKLAVEQVETAITTLRHDGDARSAEFLETRLLLARALVDQLAKR